ncbi:MAG: DUF6364 family protein [Candidatus Cyclonatronum sp.]|uniref:DUF6364 family protein n=1 Tax=Cyclonatronum sp. TaxID=3024185 RepID=UPI00342A849E|nr:DUF6364 family protein [Cyclonatronum sp.]
MIQRARKRAETKGTSVSKIVADYFTLLDAADTEIRQDLPPITASVAGVLQSRGADKENYRSHLEEKYLK